MAKAKAKNPTRHIVGKVFALALLVVVALGAMAYLQVRDVERGILEVCATQQDGYVQLVLDQINLKDNRDDEEIISDILETMDASSNKYWVFSQDQTMLFVKDVTETNRYKGFSAASYWGTDDAQVFLNTLQQGAVKHDFITVDGIEYLASGSVFTYDGRDYRLCLLTNRAALLDNNDYLGARSRLLVVMLILLGLFVIVPMALAFMVSRARKRIAEQQDVIASLNIRLQEVSDRLTHGEWYDNRRHVWSLQAFEPFIGKLMERGASNAHLAQIVCDDVEAADAFVSQSSIMLSDRVIRFDMSEGIVVLLFPDNAPDEIRAAVEPLLNDGVKLGQIVPVNPEQSEQGK